MILNFQADDFLPVVREAGKAIMSFYRGNYNKTLKEDKSPLTDADRASHQVIQEGLNRIAPDIPVVSEEGNQVSDAIRRNWSYYFLVDPLDGTREFVQNIDEFAVNIALIHQNQAVMGLIHAPVTGITYLAERGCGAFQVGNASARMPITKNSSGNVIIVTSRTDTSPDLENILSKIPDVGLRRMGSSLKFCLVAEGTADFYPRLIPSREWDTAAGSIIVEESGGRVYETLGNSLMYNRENSLNPPFYVFGKFFTEKVKNWKQILFFENLS
jgi:3'(2'), 5'-bisphosphate nucleotidase